MVFVSILNVSSSSYVIVKHEYGIFNTGTEFYFDASVTVLFPSISEIIKALDAVSGRHHPPAASTKQLRATLPHLSIILHVVTSPVFRPRLINDGFLQTIGALLNYMRSIDTGEIKITTALGPIRFDEILRTTFSIIESVSQHPLLLLQYRETVINAILPCLGSFTASSSGDNRILAMKLFSDISSLYLENEECAKSARDQPHDSISSTLYKVIKSFLLLTNFRFSADYWMCSLDSVLEVTRNLLQRICFLYLRLKFNVCILDIV